MIRVECYTIFKINKVFLKFEFLNVVKKQLNFPAKNQLNRIILNSQKLSNWSSKA